MGKSSKSLFIGAIASALMSGAAYSADLIPPPVVEFEPEYEIGGNLYLRGYVGFTNQEVDELSSNLLNSPGFEMLNSEFDSGGLAGGAIGYRFNEWFRADISAEYRMRVSYDGLDRFDADGNGSFANAVDYTNHYTADKSEFLVMANAFFDLGTYHGITPYVGAGLGVSYTMINNFTDTNVRNNAIFYAEDNGEWSFAWALHAGLGYEVNDRVTLDFGYRYLDLGDGAAGDLVGFDGNNPSVDLTDFKGLTSHDVTLGFRWNFGEFGHAGYGGGGYGHLTY